MIKPKPSLQEERTWLTKGVWFASKKNGGDRGRVLCVKLANFLPSLEGRAFDSDNRTSRLVFEQLRGLE